MQTIHAQAVVLPTGKVEVPTPGLPVGQSVEVTITVPAKPASGPGMLAYLKSLPPVSRTATEWEQIERELQEDKDSWERPPEPRSGGRS